MASAKTLLERGCAQDAESHARAALPSNPSCVEALCVLSAALTLQCRFAEAEQVSRAALDVEPHHPDALVGLAHTLLFRGMYGEAGGHYAEALRLDPGHPEALVYLALLGAAAPQLPNAVRHFEERLARQPDSFIARMRLGAGYQALGDLGAAMDHYQAASKLQPGLAGPSASLGVLYGAQGCPEKSIELFRKALDIVENPIWRNAYLFFLQYDASDSGGEVFNQHSLWGKRYAELARNWGRGNPSDSERKLRLGFLSGDFFRHPVAHFFEPILARLNRDQFEVFCYANVLKPDEVTDRLKALSFAWRDITKMPDAAVCQCIEDDGIDILIDLSGHTKGNRLQVLAHKPAPLQITYLGYPCTTGLDAVDYRITDAISDPPEMTRTHYTEKLLRFDGCFLTYLPPADAPAVSNAPSRNKGHITFGSFNNISKVNRRTIRLWADVLHAVPGSRIIVKHFATSYPLARERILQAFAACGIASDRVELLSAHPDINGHLDLYREIDIALDSFPYNGTTTTCEAIWMGVPVITRAGEKHAARVGATLLTCLGFSAWVANSDEEFVRAALKLSADREDLQTLRLSLRNHMSASPLLDGAGFTLGLEKALRKVWRERCGNG